MGVHRWKDLQHKMGTARRKQLRREVEQEILDMDLRGLRELVGKTQQEVAVLVEQTQGQVSETERRSDHRLSTLRRYVEALGGEIEVVATFGDKRIRLHGA
ncbi:MAG TPA: XRE family transcriptional regulator [Thermoanaerobaculia bacterium]|nr:XRE family transcriptional regulator [Thermoanaerobaculia bacterium]